MPPVRGRLIALDGLHSGLLPSARGILRSANIRGKKGGISVWDASNIFYEASQLDCQTPLSAKTLLLLYASDLSFRLRWEIEPALEDGRTVVAAPYVQTAMAVGSAAGVPLSWMENLFEFAPEPADTYRLQDSGRLAGFAEFACAALARPGLRDGMIAHLDDAENHQLVRRFNGYSHNSA